MLARLIGMLLGLALGGLGLVILRPSALQARIPPIDLGPFQSQSVFVAGAAICFGLIIFIAALMPTGRGSGGSGGGKRRRRSTTPPTTVDFTAQASADPPPAPMIPSMRPVDQEAAPPAVATSLPAPQPAPPEPHAGAPPGATFAEARTALLTLNRSENWSQAAEALRRLSSLAETDLERFTVAQDAGDFARAQGKLDWAAEAYDEALGYARQVGDFSNLAGALINVGDMAYEERRLDAATAAYEEALKLRRTLAVGAPWDMAARRNLSLALERLADVREDRGHRSRALDLYRESLGVAAGLATADPARYAEDLEVTRRRMSELEARIGV